MGSLLIVLVVGLVAVKKSKDEDDNEHEHEDDLGRDSGSLFNSSIVLVLVLDPIFESYPSEELIRVDSLLLVLVVVVVLGLAAVKKSKDEHDNEHEHDNLESSRSPRTRVCSQIEDGRGDLLECWTKPTTDVA